MAKRRAGRPTADELNLRCAALTKRNGKRCGNPPIHGQTFCPLHAVKPDETTQAAMVKAVRDAGPAAMRRLVQIVLYGKDADAIAASKIVMDRVMPRPGMLNAVIVTPNGSESDDPQASPVEQIRARLDALMASRGQLEPTTQAVFPSASSMPPFVAQATTAQSTDDDGIVDAVLIEDPPEPTVTIPSQPEPVAPQRISDERVRLSPETVTKLSPGEEWVVVPDPRNGVPGVRRRPADLGDLAAQRGVHSHTEPPKWASGL